MIVVGYATWKDGSFELRSKAASEDVILKQWTFEKSTEGWKAKDVEKSATNSDNFTLVIGSNAEVISQKEVCTVSKRLGNKKCQQTNVTTQLNPRMEHNEVATVLRYPVNKFRIRLLIRPDSSYAQQRIGSVPVEISYRINGKKEFELPMMVMALADGAMHEFSFDFPKAMSLRQVAEFMVSFVSLRSLANTRVDVADIRIIGVKEFSVPVPIPTEKVYTCESEDGTSCTIGSCPNSDCAPGANCPRIYCTVRSGICQSGICVAPTPVISENPYCAFQGTRSEGWYSNGNLIRYAQCAVCKTECKSVGSRSEGWYDSCNSELIQYASCGDTISSPIPKISATPTRNGCYEKQVWCIKAPCPKIMVCP